MRKTFSTGSRFQPEPVSKSTGTTLKHRVADAQKALARSRAAQRLATAPVTAAPSSTTFVSSQFATSAKRVTRFSRSAFELLRITQSRFSITSPSKSCLERPLRST